LWILQSFVTPSSSASILGNSSSEFALVMTNHLLSHQLYMKLGHAITQIVGPETNFSVTIADIHARSLREERSSTESASHRFSDHIHVVLASKSVNRVTTHTHSYNSLLLPAYRLQHWENSPLAFRCLRSICYHLTPSLLFVQRIQSSSNCQSHGIRAVALSAFQPEQLDTYLSLLASVLRSLPSNALEPHPRHRASRG